MSRINIEVPREDHQKLKIIAAAKSTSIKELVLEAIKEKIESQLRKKPNEETLAAFSETETGTGITKHTNLTDFFTDLGLNEEDQIN